MHSSPDESGCADGQVERDGLEESEYEEDMEEALGVRPGVDGVVLGRRYVAPAPEWYPTESDIA